jgi:hypothetical protein
LRNFNRTVKRFTIALFSVLLAFSMLSYVIVAMATGVIKTAVPMENVPPIAEEQSYVTYRNIPVSGTFAAYDPEGEFITFRVQQGPSKGTVEAFEDGTFIYTPNSNFKGSDKFVYVAIDESGNISENATVLIVVRKQSTDVSYSDMEGNRAHYAALSLAENGIFIGEKCAGNYFFRPDEAVTKGEFLAMCLNMFEVETIQGVKTTGFYDDEEISRWEKPYVSTALLSGVIRGYKDDAGNVVFSSQKHISLAEASVILNNMLNVTDVSSAGSFGDGLSPDWAAQAAMNLYACDVLNASDALEDEVTRADAAELLVSAKELIDGRRQTSRSRPAPQR